MSRCRGILNFLSSLKKASLTKAVRPKIQNNMHCYIRVKCWESGMYCVITSLKAWNIRSHLLCCSLSLIYRPFIVGDQQICYNTAPVQFSGSVSLVSVISPQSFIKMPPNVIPRNRSNEAKLWCIKVLSGAAYLFKGGKRVEHFRNITGAQETSETSQSTSGSSPTVKKLVQVGNNMNAI